MAYSSTNDVPLPDDLLSQVIGQEEAVAIVRQAAISRRHLVLVGEPGTGKSMLGRALAQHLPQSDLQDLLAFPNAKEPTMPLIKKVPAGQAHAIAAESKEGAGSGILLMLFAILASLAIVWWANSYYTATAGALVGAIYTATAAGLAALALLASSVFLRPSQPKSYPAVLLSNKSGASPPFIDGTGAPVASLLGDVQHDPYQTGGLGTPAHMRIQLGLIHRAHGGVLFVDEIGTLPISAQQELLTALQDGSFPITGHNETSAGAGIRTEPVPCKFVLVAAGNMDSLIQMHPALRDRVRGNGYEVLMKNSMPDTEENRLRLWQFVAQEVHKDNVPHFDAAAMRELISVASKSSGKKGTLTLRLRQLGGLVRAAGDIAKAEGSPLVLGKHVKMGAKIARSIEEQQKG